MDKQRISMAGENLEAKDFRAIRISLASPDEIRDWSYGEVTKPETINYRRLRPEKDGLFCEAIFGPTKDYQCYCGKYKNIRYRGIICDKCGVEVTKSSVRRERMGHIELAAPVAHVWYTRRVPSYLGLLLDVSRRNLDRVLYFAQYVVTNIDEEARNRALDRLKEAKEQRERELVGDLDERIHGLRAQRDQAMQGFQGRLEQIDLDLNHERDQRAESIIQEAQSLQQAIESHLGQTFVEELAFQSTGTRIAAKGEVADYGHVERVKNELTAALNELQSLIEDRRTETKARLEGDVDLEASELEFQIAQLLDERTNRVVQIEEMTRLAKEELEKLQVLQFLSEPRYRELRQRYGQVFKADMGAEALLEILKHMNLDTLSLELWNEVRTTRSKQKRKKATKRLKVVESLRKSSNRPDWMILTVLPVIPPDLRPMVQLDGGRFATSDLNDLYRRVINRNNRLKRLLELGAPDVIVRNEKRMLQEAVDSLIDNSQRGKALSRRGRRELKSLSDMLKGKKGRFRRNLLGKRVDYSGRSVIVIGPQLKLHQCGLPKMMALELFRPFVIAKLVKYNYATNVKSAKRIIERERPEVWEVLEEAISERPVLLNRAPTLHRLGIQAFESQLVEGKAIQIHPLVCSAFNADFDGDQMAVHVPLSDKAVEEARNLMLSTKNLLKPADGSPVVAPAKDMVLGNYYLTMDPTAEIVTLPERADEFRQWAGLFEGRYRVGVVFNSAGAKQVQLRELYQNNEIITFRDLHERNEEGAIIATTKADQQAFTALLNGEVDVLVHNAHLTQSYAKKKKLNLVLANLTERQMVVDLDEVEHLYALGLVGLHTPILLGNYYDHPDSERPERPEICTVGRAIFNRILPDGMRFVQETMDKKNLQKLVSEVYLYTGQDDTTEIVDQIKNLGFKYATVSGTTIAVSDLTIPPEREQILQHAETSVESFSRSYRRGLMTDQERYLRTVNSWNEAKEQLQSVIKDTLDPFGPIAVMAISGSTKGGFGPITQLAGMRGLMADPSGRIIDLPIRSNFRGGLTAQEYFISTHGARKGLADTALRTADAGYLTRRLVDVTQDVIVNREDCGTKQGIWIVNPRHPDHTPSIDADADIAGQNFQERIFGRVAARPVTHPETGEIMVDRNQIITQEIADKMAAANVEMAYVRSPMTCNLIHGICAFCYGMDLGRGRLVEKGTAVGIIAAQSIGEPGTQLTLRTFHTGGTAEKSGDITTGLPRVEEIFESRRKPKGECVMINIGGQMRVEERPDGSKVAIVTNSEVFREEHELPLDAEVLVASEDEVRERQILIRYADEREVIAKAAGRVYIEGHTLIYSYERGSEEEYEIPASSRLRDEIAEKLRNSKTGYVEVEAGIQLTEGSRNPHQILKVLGEDSTQRYLLKEVQQVYRNQGVNISDKHFEVVIRKMLSKVTITRSGDSDLLPGDLIDKRELLKTNERLIAEGLEPAAGVPILLGVTKAALSTDSFLSASSFQHTIKVLAGAAIEGKEDRLYGLKENVIIGKLIASGTGFHTYQDRELTVSDITLADQGALDTLSEIDEDEDEEYDEYDRLADQINLGDDDEDEDDDDDDDDDNEEDEDAGDSDDDLDVEVEDSEPGFLESFNDDEI
jgi:DNA-directed RNA polymerase subunit beta'